MFRLSFNALTSSALAVAFALGAAVPGFSQEHSPLPFPEVIASEKSPSAGDSPESKVRTILQQSITLELRDATLLEALFAIRDASGLNLIVGNEVTGTINASFTDTPVHQVLDSMLLARGYGYRIIGGSIAIVALQSLGDQLPMFETNVVQLQVMSPADLLPTVQSLLSPEGRVHAVASSNALVIMDYPERLRLAQTQIASLEKAALAHQPHAAPGSANRANSLASGNQSSPGGRDLVVETLTVVRVFRPQYVPAANLAENIRSLLTPAGQVSHLPLEDKLMVVDVPAAIDRIAEALVELDTPRPQVRIWAMIYDCGIEDIKRIGVNWRSGVNGAGLDAATGNAAQSVVLDTVTSSVSAGSPNGALTLTSLNQYANVTGIIQCLNSADDSRLLADPNVVVMNHEAANIEIVTEVPYQQLTQGIQGGAIGTTEFREAGVSLTVTPHIAQDGTIALIVNPRFSLLTGFTETDEAPIIDRRETTTTVRVHDRQTLILGGLRQRTRITERNAVPGLSKIPYLGHLFRYKRNATRESELIVFITPEIVCAHYEGTPRESFLRESGAAEIEQTPTEMIPFGMQTIEAEDRAKERAIDRCIASPDSQGECSDASPYGRCNSSGCIE